MSRLDEIKKQIVSSYYSEDDTQEVNGLLKEIFWLIKIAEAAERLTVFWEEHNKHPNRNDNNWYYYLVTEIPMDELKKALEAGDE